MSAAGTMRLPLTLRWQGSRKAIVAPAGTLCVPGWADITLVKALARAFRWRKMMEAGRRATIDELARAEKIDASYVSRALRLTLLAPEIVEAVLDGRQADRITLPVLMKGFLTEWKERNEWCLSRTGPPRRAHLPGQRAHIGSDQPQSRLP